MIESSTASTRRHFRRVGTVGALLMRPDGSFVTRTDFLIDGRVPAAYLVHRTLRDVRRGGTKQFVADIVQCGPCTLSP
jgi:hypothetical protein